MSEPVRPGGQPRLRLGSLNLPRLAFIGLAYFSLAPVIYLNMGFMETLSGGPVMPIQFILITLAIFPTAISFAIMNNRRPSAGSGYTWLWESTLPAVGLWLGWMLMTAYVLVSALYPPAFATFFNALLAYFHVHATTWTGIGGGVAAVLIAAYMTRGNIKIGATAIGVLMIFEASFVAALALVIVIKGGALGHLSSVPFDPTAAGAGLSGFLLASVFAFLSIAGVDSVAPVAEESHTPRRLIPLATVLITAIAGLYWTLTSYGFAISVPVAKVQQYVSAGQVTPVLPIAHHYIGRLNILVPITGFTAALASFGASIYAASRIMYALAREGFIPSFLSRLDGRTGSPWNAEAIVLTLTFVLLLLVSYWQAGPESAYGYLGEMFVYFILIAYISVNLANLVFHLRHRRDAFDPVMNGVVPILGMGIDAYILARAFFVSEIGLPFRTGSSIVWFSLAWTAIGVLWAAWWARRKNLASISLRAEV